MSLPWIVAEGQVAVVKRLSFSNVFLYLVFFIKCIKIELFDGRLVWGDHGL